MAPPTVLPLLERCVEDTLRRVGRRVVLGLPIGLGKPNALVNEFYRRARADPRIELTLVTALTLMRPRGRNEMERRFLDPLVERWVGDWPDLDYALDRRAGRLPPNVRALEFYLPPGRFLDDPRAQADHLSSNYTTVVRDALDRGMNVFAQMLAAAEGPAGRRLSLGSNPDVTLELVPQLLARRSQGQAVTILGQVNRRMPFMPGEAEVPEETFDAVLEHPDLEHALYGVADEAVDLADHAIGLCASALVPDGGTLQLGIGSLSDAVAWHLLRRQQDNTSWRAVLDALAPPGRDVVERLGGRGTFERGLYANSEMFVRGFLELYRAGILRRQVRSHAGIQELLERGEIDEEVSAATLRALARRALVPRRLDPAHFAGLRRVGVFRPDVEYEDGAVRVGERRIEVDLTDPASLAELERHALGRRLEGGAVLHACFFLGPQRFYEALRALSEEERRLLRMTAVSVVNQLYGGEEDLRRVQRRDARFFNTAMKLTALGGAASDTLEDGRVVSGVGGQYNFVAMAHALSDGRSILMARSVRRDARGRPESNVVWSHGQLTIPRHLRDLVVTEYGIADLRGRTDAEVVAEVLKVTDVRFAGGLLEAARAAGKAAPDQKLPEACRQNHPDLLRRRLDRFQREGLLPRYPFGTDLSEVEQRLGAALRTLRHRRGLGDLLRAGPRVWGKVLAPPAAAAPYLERLGLARPRGARERGLRAAALFALARAGEI